MFYQSYVGREITLLNILSKCLGLTTIDVLKFRILVACHKGLDKLHTDQGQTASLVYLD